MPAKPIKLALRILRDRTGCCLCNSTRNDGNGAFGLFAVYPDRHEELSYVLLCPECTDRYGYSEAILHGMRATERDQIKSERDEIRRGITKPSQLDETRAEFAHLASLVAAGRLTTPPPLGAWHFAAVGSM